MDLGVRKMRLMTAPKVIHGLAGFGLEVVELYFRQRRIVNNLFSCIA